MIEFTGVAEIRGGRVRHRCHAVFRLCARSVNVDELSVGRRDRGLDGGHLPVRQPTGAFMSVCATDVVQQCLGLQHRSALRAQLDGNGATGGKGAPGLFEQ